MTSSVKYIRETAHLWRARLDDGGLDKRASAEFKAWMAADPLHAEAFAEAEILWQVLGEMDYGPQLSPAPSGQPDVLRRLLGGFSRPVWLRNPLLPLALAVTVLVAVMALPALIDPLQPPSMEQAATITDYETAIGELRELALADGSRVTLGAGSHITFSETSGSRRVQLLNGEAYFNVAHDPGRPFTVVAGAAEVKVTGTVFDLQRKAERLIVAVEEGSVEVSHPIVFSGNAARPATGEWVRQSGAIVSSVQLSAGDAVSASRAEGLGRTGRIAATALATWRNGQLVYVGASLDEVIADVNRYRAEPVSVNPDVKGIRMFGTFDADDIEGLLNALEAALPVRLVDRNGRQVLTAAN